MDLLTKNVPKSRLGCPQALFCKGLGSSQAPLGWLLGALGRLLGALGCLLGASGASLGRSWAPLECHMLPGTAPDSIFEGPGRGPGSVWEAPG